MNRMTEDEYRQWRSLFPLSFTSGEEVKCLKCGNYVAASAVRDGKCRMERMCVALSAKWLTDPGDRK